MSATEALSSNASSTTRSSSSVTVSAPGKILLAGGYLVLESPNVGLVVAVDKRFTCHATAMTTTTTTTTSGKTCKDDDNDDLVTISVHSPQFGQTWQYTWNARTATLSSSADHNSTTNNALLEKCLFVTFLALLHDETDNHHHHLVSSLHLEIYGDNDFYSLIPHLQERNWEFDLDRVLQLPPRLPVDNSKLKTGLGSSACLVTSIVVALDCLLKNHHRPAVAVPPQQQQQQQHSDEDNHDYQKPRSVDAWFVLAQIVHSYAQGKIGSGFDVAAACYGSNVYQRLPVSASLTKLLGNLEELQQQQRNGGGGGEKQDASVDRDSVKRALHDEMHNMTNALQSSFAMVRPLPLDRRILQVMLADVAGGSESPSMARKVLAWKKTQPANQAIPYWDDLKKCNQQVVDILQQVHALSWSQDEKETTNDNNKDEALLQQLATTKAENEWTALQSTTMPEKQKRLIALLLDLRSTLQTCRKHLKQMGQAVGVPIEPPEQTHLCDATMQLPGVVAAVVPGAGGYDAIVCIYINTPSVRLAIGQAWASYRATDNNATVSTTSSTTTVCPLAVQGLEYGQGVRIEEEES